MEHSSIKRFKPCAGMVCAIDATNASKSKESEIPSHVVVMNLAKRKLFNKSIWRVRDVNSLEAPDVKDYFVPEYLLFPANMWVIRYPDDIPTFNDMDLAAINNILTCLEEKTEVKITDINRLKAVKQKINTSLKSREV